MNSTEIEEILAKARECPILGGRCMRSYGTKLLGSLWRSPKYKETWVLVGFYRNGAHFRLLKKPTVSYAARFSYIRSKLKPLTRKQN